MNDNELTPTTGVYNGGDLAWEFLPDDGIDLEYEEALAEGIDPDELEYWEGGSTLLYGDWIKTNERGEPDDGGKWEPDRSGEYAMIYNGDENTAQVVWSRWVRYGKPASLCYPGQVDAELDDPTEPEGEPGTVQPWDQMRATERRYVPYYALPGLAQRGED